MNAAFHSLAARQGSALVLVLWCVMLLSLAVFAVVEMVAWSLDHASYEQSALEAQTWAANGAALGQVPQILPDDPLLQQQDSAGHSFRVTIESEGARLNLNYLLSTDHRDVLINLFTSWGLKMSEAQRATDCLYDWITPGDLPSLDGAKAKDYAEAGLPQRPTHHLFQSWAEVSLVMGMDRVAEEHPDWQDSLTIWSEGPLDLNTAPAERIAARFGVETGRVEPLVAIRNGHDGVAGTSDDVALTPALVQSAIGLTNQQMTALQSEVAFGSNVRRIESVGQAGSARSRLTLVAPLRSSPPQFFVWSER